MDKMINTEICIIGGGLSGATTGILLNLLGYKTKILTVHRADEFSLNNSIPEFASIYACASVLTHSVNVADLQEKITISQEFFNYLHRSAAFGVRKQKHYEVFEFRTQIPDYAYYVDNFNLLPLSGAGIEGAPRRSQAESIYGWYFDCLFAEPKTYIERIYEFYELTGGKIFKQKVTRENIKDIDAKLIVNCSGCWTKELFDDEADCYFSKGNLVYVKTPQMPVNQFTNECFSYNYKPLPEVYHNTTTGESSDIYFYPRSDSVVLGGSRLKGAPDEDGKWQGEEMSGDKIKIGDTEVPQAIISENKDILHELTGINIDEYEMHAVSGYRFVRDCGEMGIRIEHSRDYGIDIIHNYGHGGAGLTLSWGCSAQVVQLVQQYVKPELTDLEFQSGKNYDRLFIEGLRELANRFV